MVCNLAPEAKIVWFYVMTIEYKGLCWAKNSELAVGMLSSKRTMEIRTQLQRRRPGGATSFSQVLQWGRETWLSSQWSMLLALHPNAIGKGPERCQWAFPSLYGQQVAELEMDVTFQLYSLLHFHSTYFKNKCKIKIPFQGVGLIFSIRLLAL